MEDNNIEMEELKNKYSFSNGLMEKIKHSIEVLRKGGRVCPKIL